MKWVGQAWEELTQNGSESLLRNVVYLLQQTVQKIILKELEDYEAPVLENLDTDEDPFANLSDDSWTKDHLF